ncbi:MAG: hypothetical protein CM15mP73_4610 [Hyphomicrobiales bacterium]|nr:MAG: hypothetical protein CM15mP73_4610 [Hyphomicrobiales bacterium]
MKNIIKLTTVLKVQKYKKFLVILILVFLVAFYINSLNIMQISVLTEHDQLETRVALSPDTVKKLVSNGLNVIIQSGCGQQSNYSDQQYEEAGANVTRTISDKVLSSDILVTVKRPMIKS